jgi:hypothetical protein
LILTPGKIDKPHIRKNCTKWKESLWICCHYQEWQQTL